MGLPLILRYVPTNSITRSGMIRYTVLKRKHQEEARAPAILHSLGDNVNRNGIVTIPIRNGRFKSCTASCLGTHQENSQGTRRKRSWQNQSKSAKKEDRQPKHNAGYHYGNRPEREDASNPNSAWLYGNDQRRYYRGSDSQSKKSAGSLDGSATSL